MPAYAVKCICSIGGREKKTNMSVSHTDAESVFNIFLLGLYYVLSFFRGGGGVYESSLFLIF